ncbi:MAG: hypothetical protein QOK39_1779 [Acidimicrobiaceae bacterium]|nr:hypothetical protein [Acidimicrobiaceae bacterium]
MILSVISLAVVMVLTVMGAHACSASSPSSNLNPLNVARNGLAGLCANQQATAAAGGAAADTGSPATAVSPAVEAQLQQSDPSGLNALKGAAGAALLCPTTTLPPVGP